MSTKLERIGLVHASVLMLAGAIGASCSDGDGPTETPTPKITTFTATPNMVAEGGTVMLTYAVTDATAVKIDIMGGANVLPSSTVLSGTATSPALNETTVFVLTATNEDKSATRTVMVTVEDAPPMRAVISSFTANPTSVDPGASSTLSWTTMNAESGTIRIGGTEITTIDAASLASGTYVADNIQAATTYTLAVKGPDGQEVTLDVTVQLNGPSIGSFTATPDMINQGDSTTLAWSVTNATNIVVTGATSGEVYNGAMGTHSITLTPGATEVFTLVATGAANQMATQNVTVTVTPPMGALINSFTASPSAIDIGQSSTLTWDVTRAPGGIEISSGGTVLHLDGMSAMGTFEVTPIVTTTYTLRAINTAGDATMDVTVTVNPSAPAIIAFTATPDLLGIGGTTILDWTTLGATQIDIEANGVNVYSTMTQLDVGMTTVVVNDAVTTFVLIATNPDGNNTFSARVVAHTMPVINSFTVSPAAVLTNDPVTITWDVSSANELSLNANGMPVANFPTVSTGTTAGAHSGSITVNLTTPTTFELVARSAAGEVRSTASATTLIAELEPNNTSSTAIPLPGNGSGVNGTLTAGDEDWYSVVLVDGGHVIIETSDGAGACPAGMDTIVTFIAPDGTTTIFENDDIGGGNFCSRIDGRVTPQARDLAAGVYFIVVTHYSPTGTGPYTLFVTAGAPGCGNAVLDRAIATPEQCDDGNLTANDGCSASCTAEAQGVLAGPNAESTFTGTLDPGNQVDFYQVTMPIEGYVRAETFAPSSPNCTGADTIVRLYDASFVELGSDDNDGVASCSLINPLVDAFSHVQAGTYWVSVESRLRARIDPYSLVVRALPYGCGNGILEGMEQCDDGNNVVGDGCDVSCMFEGTQENEVAGNNGYNGAGVITVSADTLFLGAIIPVGDVDFYGVTVPQGYHLDAYVTVNSLTSCAVGGPRGQLQLVDIDGTTQLATNSAGGPDANCGRISPSTTITAFEMDAGTYYLRVREVGDDAEIPTYYLHVAVIAPGCANGVREGAEQCDDRNTTDGDGCSSACLIEPDATFNAPGAATTYSGAIDPAGDLDYYRIVVSGGPVYIDAETFDNATAGTCATGIDTVLRLYNDALVQLASDDEGGVNSCSHFVRSRPEARLDPGVYFISVEDYLNNGTIPTYELVLQAFDADVCGNGVVESTIGERCDDGNLNAGDGCSPSCIVEPVGTFAAPGGPTTFTGAITVVGGGIL